MGKTLAELFFKYRSNHRIIENMFLASKRCLGLARVPHSLSSFAFLLLILYLLWKFFAQILIFLSFWHCYIKGRKNFVGKSQLIKYFTQPYVDLLLCTNGHPLFQLSGLIMHTHRRCEEFQRFLRNLAHCVIRWVSMCEMAHTIRAWGEIAESQVPREVPDLE